jgi:hypothetical protein
MALIGVTDEAGQSAQRVGDVFPVGAEQSDDAE